mmetsp:Transcript_41554/g.69419  ORF Transcript_41554/g.69419 Transcript_41554/m.69419 type:complete len:248 (+) Transcript_41554:1106-1849(+)
MSRLVAAKIAIYQPILNHLHTQHLHGTLFRLSWCILLQQISKKQALIIMILITPPLFDLAHSSHNILECRRHEPSVHRKRIQHVLIHRVYACRRELITSINFFVFDSVVLVVYCIPGCILIVELRHESFPISAIFWLDPTDTTASFFCSLMKHNVPSLLKLVVLPHCLCVSCPKARHFWTLKSVDSFVLKLLPSPLYLSRVARRNSRSRSTLVLDRILAIIVYFGFLGQFFQCSHKIELRLILLVTR